MMSEQVDWTAALAGVNGDRRLLRMVIDAFLRECVELQVKISKAIANDDAKLLHRCGHTLKGTMMSMGADAWCEPAMELEELGASGTTDGAREPADRLNSRLPLLLEQLRTFCVQQDD